MEQVMILPFGKVRVMEHLTSNLVKSGYGECWNSYSYSHLVSQDNGIGNDTSMLVRVLE